MCFLSKKISLASLLLFLSSSLALWGQNLYYLGSDGTIYKEQSFGAFEEDSILLTNLEYTHIQFGHGITPELYIMNEKGLVYNSNELNTAPIANFSSGNPFFLSKDNATVFSIYSNTYYDNNETEVGFSDDAKNYNDSIVAMTKDFLFLYEGTDDGATKIASYAINYLLDGSSEYRGGVNIYNEGSNELAGMATDTIGKQLYWIQNVGEGFYSLYRSPIEDDGSLSQEDLFIQEIGIDNGISSEDGASSSTILDMVIDPVNKLLYLLTKTEGQDDVIATTSLYAYPMTEDGLGEPSFEEIDQDLVSIKVKYTEEPFSPLFVRNNLSSGLGSLDNAIVYANSHAEADTIHFVDGLDTIKLYDPLPAIIGDSTVILGGVDENGFPKVTLLMEEENSGGGLSQELLSIGYEDEGTNSENTTHCHIQGLNILNLSGGGTAIHIDGDSNQISSCVIGIDSKNDEYGFETGISVEGNYNMIGGTTESKRNVISANDYGVSLRGSENIVDNNYIGTSLDGNSSIANKNSGVFVNYDGSNNLIGDTAQTGMGNVIFADLPDEQSYQNVSGIYIGGASNTYIVKNRINISADSTKGIATSGVGIHVFGGENNTIGGKELWENYIYSSDTSAIYCSTSGDDFPLKNTIISYNTLGLLPDSSGIDGETGIYLGPDVSTVAVSNNIITNQGIVMYYSQNTGFITLYANSIYGNDYTFDYGADDITITDPPKIEDYDKSTHTVSGYANDGDIIQFFADTAGQGQVFLDAVELNGSDEFSFKIDPSIIPDSLDYLTAMATNPTTKNTSVFSKAIYVDFDCDPLLVSTEEAYGCGSLHDAIIYANKHEGADTIRFAEGLTTLQLTPNALPVITDDSTMILGELGEDGIPKTTIFMLGDQNTAIQVETTRETVIAVAATDVVYSFESLFSIGYKDDFNEVFNPVSHCEIKNLTLVGDNSGLGTAINIFGDSNQVSSCIIGIDANNEAKGFRTGLLVKGDHNIIGGKTDVERNVISGNNYGIILNQAKNNLIYNNYLGANLAGDASVANTITSIYAIGDQSYGNMIGDTLSGIGNVIFSNTSVTGEKTNSNGAGVFLEGVSNTYVVNNLLNISADSSQAIDDSHIALYISEGEENIIGGDEDWGNYIHSDDSTAIYCINNGADKSLKNATISFNVLGLSPKGDQLSGHKGIYLDGKDRTTEVLYNTITNQGTAILYGEDADSITLHGNSIYGNDVAFEGEPSDPNEIPYDLSYDKSTNTVTGSANDGDIIQFFADTAGQGQVFLGVDTVNFSGEFSFQVDTSKMDKKKAAYCYRLLFL